MERSLKASVFLLFLFSVFSITPLRPGQAQSIFYKYVDKNGNLYFTDRLEAIPEEFRGQVKLYREEEAPQAPFSKEPEIIEEQALRMKKAEERKKEEEKALREKAAQLSFKERQELQDRIANLQEQIQAKQKEQESLRTSPMVYDQLRLKQLNAEIFALRREVLSLRREFSQKEIAVLEQEIQSLQRK